MAERKSKPEGALASDVRARTPDQLQELLLNLRREQFNLRFQRATGQTEGTARVKIVRRSIARVKTILAERSAAERSAAEKSMAETARGAGSAS